MDENTVSPDQVKDALADLQKLANLAKGGVSNSGRVDEDGMGGGGTSPDNGKVDDLMIGKMAAAMAEAGIDAGAIEFATAAMASAKMGEDEESDEDEEFDEDEDEDEAEKSDASLMDLFKSEETFDVSPFLERFAAGVSETIGSLQKSINTKNAEQEGLIKAQSAALVQVGELLKSQAHVIAELGNRLQIVERQPAAPKGVTSTAGLAKAMPGEAGSEPGAQVGNREELASVLSYMNLEKSIRQLEGAGMPTSHAVTAVETGSVRKSVVDAANDFLKANPKEAAKALSYR